MCLFAKSLSDGNKVKLGQKVSKTIVTKKVYSYKKSSSYSTFAFKSNPFHGTLWDLRLLPEKRESW